MKHRCCNSAGAWKAQQTTVAAVHTAQLDMGTADGSRAYKHCTHCGKETLLSRGDLSVPEPTCQRHSTGTGKSTGCFFRVTAASKVYLHPAHLRSLHLASSACSGVLGPYTASVVPLLAVAAANGC